ncbi:MAG: hypothetical protein Q9165_007679 [Trypethelium subeluteriae]
MEKERQSDDVTEAPPSKKPRLMLDENESGDDEAGYVDGETYLGASPPRDYFKINEEYAKRFEHNKKREEHQRLEEKYGRSNGVNGEEPSESDESSSEDESEDDEGLLATQDVDAEIMDTLHAIRSKDPRIYDKNKTFFRESNAQVATLESESEVKEKPMYLHDYHRKNLLAGYTGDGQEGNDQREPLSYTEEQNALKKQLLQEMHNATGDDEREGDNGSNDDDGDDFLKAKPTGKAENSGFDKKNLELGNPVASVPDPITADRDPETYLSNFMSSRAWVPDARSRWQPFDSDDSEDEARADAFEEAYNMRFEDPERTNEKLTSHARDVISKYSVRREEPKGRKKTREKERAKKEEAKRQRGEEKARLRKLRIESVEDKVKKIKEAAGLKKSDSIDLAEWEQFLDEGWNDDEWETEMKKRFGESYYAESQGERPEKNGEKGGGLAKNHKKDPNKPRWDDDIDIKDLVSDFEDNETRRPQFTLTDDEEDAVDDKSGSSKPNPKRDRLKSKTDTQRVARKQRRQIEALVDTSLDTDPSFLAPSNSSKAHSSTTTEIPRFHYRETSPTSFGLTARDILLANDAQLNQYAGLKKMAAFRDPERKRRDRKKLGKKARLREWRREVFGDEGEPKGGFRDEAIEGRSGNSGSGANAAEEAGGEGSQKGKKKRRRGKKKNKASATSTA